MKILFLSLLPFLYHSLSLSAQKIQPTYKNISYGPHQDMTLNFWKLESDQPVPLLVHIHGGGWIGGKKNESIGLNELKKGYSFASIDYRLAGTELLPAAVHDAARAIQFLRTKAKMWNFNPARIGVIGGSAGAASSLWLAYHDDMSQPQSKDPVLRQSSRVCGAVAMGGQTTLDPFLLKKKIGPACIRHGMIWKTVGAKSIEDLMDNWDQYKELSLECSPITHVSKDDPPVFLNYGKPAPTPVIKGDGIHHAGFGRLLKEKCKKVGVDCYLQVKDHEAANLTKDQFIQKILFDK
jgi:acetyl esterase/lipase